MAHDVFISYSSGDKPTADAIVNALETRGVRGWIAPRDVLPGEDWGSALVRAIEHARVMVLVFSSHANASRQVSREVQLAFENNLTVIPFRVEDVLPTQALKYYLSPVHWLDALTPPLAQHIRLLADRIQSYLDAVSGGHPPPVDDPAPPPAPGPIATAPATEPSQPEAYKELADAEEAVQRGPKSASAYWSRGNAYWKKGKPDKAIADYTEAIRLDPRHALAYYNRGVAYAARGEPRKAIADYTESIRLDPRHILDHYYGFMYAARGEPDKVIAEYTEAIRFDPNFANAYGNRGIVYPARGEPENANADIRVDPRYELACYNWGAAYAAREPVKAICDYTEAIRRDPKFALSYAGRANSCFIMGAAEKASADIEEAIRLDPNLGFAYEVRANLREAWAGR